MRPLLLPFSVVYGAAVAIRNWFFDIGVLRIHRVGVPVISVGNLSTGGVGKTPLVEMLSKRLAQQGRRVAIVSRGYKRETRGTLVVSNGSVRCAEAAESGDEPAQMASKLSGVIVIVDEKRTRGASYAVEKFGADVIVLDDGFQHRYLHRDTDIVILSAQEITRRDWLLPAGNRREPLTSLRRATLVAVSRCESIDQFEQAKSVVRQWTNKPVVGLATRVSAFRRASTRFSIDIGGLKGRPIVAFSGVGNPKSFEQTLMSLGLEMKKHFVFPDHHFYSKNELGDLEASVQQLGADYLVTTEKDIARLDSEDGGRKQFLERAPLFYVEIESSVPTGETALNDATKLN